MASGDYIGEGGRINYTAGTTAVSKGDVVVVRSGATGMIGVAIDDIAASGTGPVAIEGVFKITKSTATATGIFSVGDSLYWDVAGGHINSQASANVPAGICMEAAAAAATTVKIKLVPSKAT